ncbi:SLC13 family permease [Wenzhouxiangella limi]|uniref:SLC13 family permease n=1 Tax=Wenzhouxiangella limi TaxID=2707351 RepID=A0A845V2X1_9GAMM|nr:SLC13 family permease [Wenzhouxiangella limi]NDY97064.1 SLC13 family permease [Wenzhouxiangella limi]
MSIDQVTILAILLTTIVLFVWGRWRHDLVAAAALLACVIFGLVPGRDAFEGFGHPAVITVAAILILSRALQTSGAVDILTERMLPKTDNAFIANTMLVSLAAFLSAFMNNVGALALLMPVAIQLAQKHGLAPGQMLMPLAFGSILGGMMTLIGTPPNLIVSGFRADAGMGAFTMFDFTPVGVVVVLAGLAVIFGLGRFLIPVRERSDLEDFDTGDYLTEARIAQKSDAVGMRLSEAEDEIEDTGSQIVGLIRDEERIRSPHGNYKLQAGDILVIEAEPKALVTALSKLNIRLEEDKREPQVHTRSDQADSRTSVKKPAKTSGETSTQEPDRDKERKDQDDDKRGESREAEEIVLMEVVVMPSSSIIGRSARALKLRTQYDINLLAVSRQGQRTIARLKTLRFRPSDVLLLQGPLETVHEFAVNNGCIPLAERSLRIPRPGQALAAAGIMLGAVAIAALGLLPTAVAFVLGVLATVLTRLVPARKVYEAIDWPVIVLLGALIPVAGAMESTGAADLITRTLLDQVAGGGPILAMIIVMVVTIVLSSVMNNAATAAVMCPIALSSADVLDVNPDSLLMAVAVGASCAFLTPIAHQNNTLILGPGGFRFGDYWRLGLPLEIIVVAVGVPMILLVWPL